MKSRSTPLPACRNGMFFDNSLNDKRFRIDIRTENGYEEGCTRGAKFNPLISAVFIYRTTPWGGSLGVSSFPACPRRLTPARTFTLFLLSNRPVWGPGTSQRTHSNLSRRGDIGDRCDPYPGFNGHRKTSSPLGERPANPVFFLRALGIMFADDA